MSKWKTLTLTGFTFTSIFIFIFTRLLCTFNLTFHPSSRPAILPSRRQQTFVRKKC